MSIHISVQPTKENLSVPNLLLGYNKEVAKSRRPAKRSLTSEFNTSKNKNCSLMKIQKSPDTDATDVTGKTACKPVLEVASDENILDDYCKNKESGCDVESSNATQDSVCANRKTLARLTMHYLHYKNAMLNSKLKRTNCGMHSLTTNFLIRFYIGLPDKFVLKAVFSQL